MADDVVGYVDRLDGTCGVGLAYSFTKREKPWKSFFDPTIINHDTRPSIEKEPNDGGAGWLVAGFVNTPICKKAYALLSGKHKMIYQSPVRTNSNSGRRFFFCLFDTSPNKREFHAVGVAP